MTDDALSCPACGSHLFPGERCGECDFRDRNKPMPETPNSRYVRIRDGRRDYSNEPLPGSRFEHKRQRRGRR